MYRAQEHRQAAPKVSSSGKVLECLVSGQGLGCSRMLMENPVLIFRLAVRRRSTEDADPVSRRQSPVPKWRAKWRAKWLPVDYQERRVQRVAKEQYLLTAQRIGKIHNCKADKLECVD